MYVDLRSAIGRGIMVRGEFDPAIWRALEPYLSGGDTFLDVGCNIGYYTILAANRVGPKGEVHAFDIDPRPLKCLFKTLRRNMVRNVIVHAYALADIPGIGGVVTSAESGHTHLSQLSVSRRVPVLPLDAWASYFRDKRIAAIKIDVEGHDLNVLKGSIQILTAHKPAIVCEGNPPPGCPDGNEKEAISTFLAQYGYQAEPIPGASNRDLLFIAG
jgi:FkbM family methyltransferase